MTIASQSAFVWLLHASILLRSPPAALAWSSTTTRRVAVAPSTRARTLSPTALFSSSATVDYLSSLSSYPPPPSSPIPSPSSECVQVITPSSNSRADEEATLLRFNQSPLPGPSSDDASTLARSLSERGVGRANVGRGGLLSVDTAEELRRYVDGTLERSIDEVESFRCPRAYRFANVLEKGHRWDLLLPFGDDEDGEVDGGEAAVILRAMKELLGGPNSAIGTALETLLGPNARLYELACLISDPGSNRQEIHPDILVRSDDGDKIPLIACFVSLQDVDENMGPTVFLPGTATEYHHQCINDPKLANDMLRETPSYVSTIGAGDCSLYDPRILHAGGGNVSHLSVEGARRRRLFYFTFLHEDAQDMAHDVNPGSIRPDVKGKNLSLAEIRRVLGPLAGTDR